MVFYSSYRGHLHALHMLQMVLSLSRPAFTKITFSTDSFSFSQQVSRIDVMSSLLSEQVLVKSSSCLV